MEGIGPRRPPSQVHGRGLSSKSCLSHSGAVLYHHARRLRAYKAWLVTRLPCKRPTHMWLGFSSPGMDPGPSSPSGRPSSLCVALHKCMHWRTIAKLGWAGAEYSFHPQCLPASASCLPQPHACLHQDQKCWPFHPFVHAHPETPPHSPQALICHSHMELPVISTGCGKSCVHQFSYGVVSFGVELDWCSFAALVCAVYVVGLHGQQGHLALYQSVEQSCDMPSSILCPFTPPS